MTETTIFEVRNRTLALPSSLFVVLLYMCAGTFAMVHGQAHATPHHAVEAASRATATGSVSAPHRWAVPRRPPVARAVIAVALQRAKLGCPGPAVALEAVDLVRAVPWVLWIPALDAAVAVWPMAAEAGVGRVSVLGR